MKVPYIKQVYTGSYEGHPSYQETQAECIDKVWIPTYEEAKTNVAYGRGYEKRWIRNLDYWVQHYWTYYDGSKLEMDKAQTVNYYDFMFAL